jgi:hypothetical protein
MSVTIDGTGTVTGLSTGGLPDGSIAAADLATDAVTGAKIIANAVDETKLKDALVADFTEVVVTASDSILLGDATDSGNTKRDTVQGLLDLVPAAGITLGTMVASTSGTAIDFTGIPSGTKRITINLNRVSTNGTGLLRIQLGDAGGIETSGYLCGNRDGAGNGNQATVGFDTGPTQLAAWYTSGTMVCNLIDAGTFLWAAHWVTNHSGGDVMDGAGIKPLSAVLTQVRFTNDNGSTFDAGSINISYE